MLEFIITLLVFLPMLGMAWADSLRVGHGDVLSDNANNLSDFTTETSLHYSIDASDSVDNWADAQAQNLASPGGLTLNLSDDLNNWNDSCTKNLGYIKTDSDTLSFADALAKILSYELALADSEAANWADAHQLLLSQRMALSDQANNLVDSVILGLGLNVSDNANQLADAIQIGYDLTASDQLTLSDSHSEILGLNILLSDDANNLADFEVEKSIVYLITAEDDLNNWADNLAPLSNAGFVWDTFTESSDTSLGSHTGEIGTPWLAHPSESADNMTIDALTDRLYASANGPGLWYSTATPNTPDYYVEADFFNRSAENTNIGICARLDISANTYYVLRLNTGTQWQLRKVVAGTPSSLGTSNNQIPSVGQFKRARLVVLGDQISAVIEGVTEISVTDATITAAGRPGIRASGAVSATTGTHLDNYVAVNLGMAVGHTKELSDDLNTPWADAYSQIGHGFLPLADNSNNLQDAYSQIGDGKLSFSDTLGLTDAYTQSIEHRLTFSDNANNLADDYSQAGNGLLSLSDSANNLQDAYSQIGDGKLSFSDALGLTDAYAQIIEHRVVLSDNANNLADSCEKVLGQQWEASDNANNLADAFAFFRAGAQETSQSDSLNSWADFTPAGSLHYAITASDDVNNWNDSASVVRENPALNLTLSLSDNLNNWGDFVPTVNMRQELQLNSDDLDNWQDAEQHLVGIPKVLSDSFTISDSVAMRMAMSMHLADGENNWNENCALRLDYFLSLSDNADNLADEFVNSAPQGPLITLGFGESINNWNDSSTVIGVGSFAFSDSIPPPTDAFEFSTGQSVSASEQLVLSDALQLLEEQRLSFNEVLSQNDAIILFSQWFLNFAEQLSQTDQFDFDLIGGPFIELEFTEQLGQSDHAQIVLVNAPNLFLSFAESFTITDSATTKRGLPKLGSLKVVNELVYTLKGTTELANQLKVNTQQVYKLSVRFDKVDE